MEDSSGEDEEGAEDINEEDIEDMEAAFDEEDDDDEYAEEYDEDPYDYRMAMRENTNRDTKPPKPDGLKVSLIRIS